MCKTYCTFAIGLLFSTIWGCASSQEFTSAGTDLKKYRRIAVLPFFDHPMHPGSGMIVADLVTNKLHASGFNIVDRMQTARVLQEQGFGQAGVVDETSAPVVGKVLGVQAFLTGSITRYETIHQANRAYAALDVSAVGLTLKLIDSETSQIVWSGSAKGTQLGPNSHEDAANKAIGNITKKLQKRIVLSPNNSPMTRPHQPTVKAVETRQPVQNRIQKDTFLPNFRSKVEGTENLSDKKILEAYRKKYPHLQEVSDVRLIEMIEAKYEK